MGKTTVDMDGTIPWEQTMALGAGYDIDKFQIVSSALTDLETSRSLPEEAVDTEYEFHVIRNEEELMSQIDTSTSGSCSATPLFSLDASSTYLRSIKCSATSMTTIVRCTITSRSLETLSSPKLNKDAEKCLKKPYFRDSTTEKFFDRYGQYYISGKVFQSSLVAVCTHTAKTKDQLDKLKLNMKARYKLFKLDALLDLVRKVNSSKVETKVNIQMTGTKATTVSHYIAASDLQEVVEGFILNHIPVPQAAILRHYSYLNPKKVPRPHLGSLVPTALNDAYREYLSLELRSGTCRLDKVSEILPKLAEEKKVLSALRPSMKGWQEGLSLVQQNLVSFKEDLDRLFAMQKVLQQTLRGPAKIRHDHWYEAKQTVDWAFGSTKNSSPRLSLQIAYQRIEYAEGTHHVPCGNQIIVGLRVESLRLDGHNGSWKLKAGGLGHTHSELQFSSGLFHDRKWAVEVWTVHEDNAVLRKDCTW
jgi:hypothetical protein